MSDPTDSIIPGFQPRPLHTVLVMSGVLGRVPPALVSPALFCLAAIAAWPWGAPSLQWAAGVLTLLLIVIDGLSLAMLPRKGRSFGPITPPLLALALVRTAISFAAGSVSATVGVLAVIAGIQVAITGVHLYSTWVEPFRLTVTRLEIVSTKLTGETPLRVLQISDIHFEGWTPRERRLIHLVQSLSPDLILLTGDYVSLSLASDRATWDAVRDLMASISAVAPTFAIRGSPPVDRPTVVPAVFSGLDITWLIDQTMDVSIKGHVVHLVGLDCAQRREQDVPRLRQVLDTGSAHLFTTLLYHSPDLMPEAVQAGVDLYLAGHTHGGQLCLPVIGALVTSSEFGKRYEGGLYREGETTLYVSRGLGMEGMGAPRARFLAPPEIALLVLRARE